ncbi:MAG: hypothetical protein [Caudoviricetes sp.]|nr:MAG: hypothetical protein [Caudoviricetes sp.]
MSQKWYVSHAETITQNIVGLLIGFIILNCFGLTASESVQLQAVIFATSYLRSYVIRRVFNNLEAARGGND